MPKRRNFAKSGHTVIYSHSSNSAKERRSVSVNEFDIWSNIRLLKRSWPRFRNQILLMSSSSASDAVWYFNWSKLFCGFDVSLGNVKPFTISVTRFGTILPHWRQTFKVFGYFLNNWAKFWTYSGNFFAIEKSSDVVVNGPKMNKCWKIPIFNVLVSMYLFLYFVYYLNAISNCENILKTLLTSVNQP